MSEEVEGVSVPFSVIKNSPEQRLNASAYSFSSIKAINLLESLKNKGQLIMNLKDFLSDIFVGARSKRLFTSKREGIPYLMPIDLFMFHLKPRKWVKKETEDLENWWVKAGTILITQSGTPGRTIITNKLFEDKVVSPNVIRVVPNSDAPLGYIYAYLNTWIGQALLTKTQYGATVKHIEPHHVASIPIPILEEDTIKKINDMILEAHKLREQAQLKLLEAEETFYNELDLPKIDEEDAEYFGREKGKLVKAFTITANELNLRLDASYHIPIVKKVLDELSKSHLNIVPMSSVLSRAYVPPRFKRIYVTPKEGVPFLLPIHSVLVKYFDIRYLWKPLAERVGYKLDPRMILITRSGTLGRVILVTDYISSWVASDDFIYAMPKKEINPGYLVIFLQSIYGQTQIIRETYGGVIKHLEEIHVTKIKLPLPDRHVQGKIGNLVIEAYELKDKANLIEEKAIGLLEKELKELAGIESI